MVNYKCVLGSKNDQLKGNSGKRGYSNYKTSVQARFDVINYH